MQAGFRQDLGGIPVIPPGGLVGQQQDVVEHYVAPTAGFDVEQLQLQPPAGYVGQGVDDRLKTLGVLPAPDGNFLAVGQQRTPTPLPAPPAIRKARRWSARAANSGESARPMGRSPSVGW